MTAKVSVIIPCYNAERWIGATLDSVFAQTWLNLEVIVVDDGSTDSSVSVIETFSDPRLRLIRQANGGACAARNLAFAESTGELIQFLDADDLIDADKIAIQARRLADAPDSVASARWGRFYDEPENTRFEAEAVSRDLDPIEWLVSSRSDGLGMLFPALWLIPRAVAESAGPWDVSLSRSGMDDGEYFTRVLLAAQRVLFCPSALCRYRSGIAGSLSKSRNWPLASRVVELCESHVRAREDSERVRRGFALSWQHLAHAAYPYDRVTAERALARASVLHPVTIRPDGGPTFKILSRLIGWRAARRLQVASGRR